MSKNSDKEKIKNALKIGMGNAKTADELQAETRIESGRTQEPLRAIIRELIKDGIPIGSLPKCGYWIIQTEEELREVIRNLESRTGGIADRIKEIRRAFNHFYKKTK